MDDLKVYEPEKITDTPLPEQTEGSSVSETNPSSGGVYSPTIIDERSIPAKRTASELISTSLNTKSKKILGEFEITQQGALQIGKYQNGVSGDVRITPLGIVARNKSGLITLSVDAETGDAVFKGSIQAGSIFAGDSAVTIEEDNGHGVIKFKEDGKTAILLGWG
jgi:hypothetical protein